ncbi:hypothetical protein ACFWMZ_28235, partial [Streptomyces sp. NPDC058373]
MRLTPRTCGFVIGATALTLAATAVPAVADLPGETFPGGGQKGDDVYAKVEVIKYDTSKNGSGPSAGAVAAVPSDWTPPPCWYAPKWTPSELRDYYQRNYEAIVHDPGMPPDARNEWNEERRNYIDGDYKDFNEEKKDEG